MKTKILFIVSIFFFLQGFSQKNFHSKDAGSSGGANNMYDLYLRTIDIDQKTQAFGLTETEFNAIKDEAYLNPKFLVGNIYQDDKLLKSNVPMRYNAYADEIEIKNHASEENYGALMQDPSIYVKIEKDIYVFIPYDDSNEKGGYFNIIADGRTYDLYKKTTAAFIEPKKAETNYQSNTSPTFEKTTKYYLVQNGKFLEMPSTKSKVLKVMDSKKKEVKDYIVENNLDVDKETDLIKAFTYFDSIL